MLDDSGQLVIYRWDWEGQKERTHVGGDKHPLRECPGRKLLVEVDKVLGLGEPAGAVADGLVADQGAFWLKMRQYQEP